MLLCCSNNVSSVAIIMIARASGVAPEGSSLLPEKTGGLRTGWLVQAVVSVPSERLT